MDIQTKDGILLRNIPDGTPDDAIKARIAEIRASNEGKASSTKTEPEASITDKAIGSFPARAAMGAAALPAGLVQFGANIGQGLADITGVTGKLGKTVYLPHTEGGPETAPGNLPLNIPDAKDINKGLRDIEESKKRGMAANGKEGFDWAGLLGQMGTGAYLTKGLPIAETLAGKVAQGAGVGGFFGFGTPVTNGAEDFGKDKAVQTVVGTATGGALPVVTKGVSAVGKRAYNLIEDHLPGGIERAAGRTANELAGDRRQAVVDELLKNKQIVPGSNATAGEAATPAGSAEFSALQKIVGARKPSDYNAIAESQQGARLDAINTVAKDKPALAVAEGARAGMAAKNYQTAFEKVIKADPELADLAKNPYFKDALPDAMKLAEAKGINPKENLTEFLHLVKLSLDKTLGKTGDTALSNTERSTVEGVKKNLVEWIGNKNPAYETARSEFAAASKPINKMQVGQYLKDKLTNPLTEAERAASFAQAVRDAPGTLKRSTGFKRYDDLGQVLDPIQIDSVQKVAAELSRKAQFDKLAQAGTERAREQLGMIEKEIPPTGMFSPIVSVARGLFNRFQGKASEKTKDYLSEAMKDPQEMAKLMQNATPKERGEIVKALMSLRTAVPIAAVDSGGP